MTQFEEQLKQFFPEIYELHILGKSMDQGGYGEVHVWKLVSAMLMMYKESKTGSIQINYNAGKISQINVREEITAYKASRPGY